METTKNRESHRKKTKNNKNNKNNEVAAHNGVGYAQKELTSV